MCTQCMQCVPCIDTLFAQMRDCIQTKKQKQTVCELNSKYLLVNTQILYSKKLKTSSQKPNERADAMRC